MCYNVANGYIIYLKLIKGETDMEYTIEAYLWRQDIQTLQRVCNLPQEEILDEVREMAQQILEYRLEQEKKKGQ